MNNREIKELFIDELFDRGVYTKKVNESEYRTRCPFCGDSSNLNTGHLYMNINLEENTKIPYHCFKCEESGIINDEMLSLLDINNINLKSLINNLNKTSTNNKSRKFLENDKLLYFDYNIPEINRRCDKIYYIEDRLGTTLSNEDLINMKVVPSLKSFLKLNRIKTLQLNSYMCSKLEDHYVGFLSFGSSHILFRDISGKEDIRWLKYPITEESRVGKVMYSISSTIDIYSTDNITINLSEGIMDILSVYKNLNYNSENIMNIAVCGKHYIGTLMSLLNMGFVGDNITVNIFADNDALFNKKKNNTPTDIKYFKKILNKIKHIYGHVNIYYNTVGKDVGVPLENISLQRYII